ncbi:hypothetical protein SAMN02927921_03939 [Sinomicrobium oceani]|uniref:Uncharacterized protein n=1 Tax=Sinomicrobium oceani TaxID=1150368 RepID=A0A1K1RRZ8_9FLAO|nr:hypothetical protein SAMN02927921_03939 [Sinomicrobium oceani]
MCIPIYDGIIHELMYGGQHRNQMAIAPGELLFYDKNSHGIGITTGRK